MSAVLAQWGVSYVPGRWIALSGPTSLVVLLPSSTGWTPLLDTLWAEVLGSTSIVALAERLAAHGLEAMTSFGAFFWTPTGMRSLVRGDVLVRDAATGAVLADGKGIQTWSELGLGGLTRIVVETPDAPDAPTPRLPLVVGAALVSSLLLDASVGAPVRSPQGDDLDTEPLTAEERAAIEVDDTDEMSLQPGTGDGLATSTLPQAEPAPARLVVSDGTTVDLSRPVRIGRAPAADGPSDEIVLLTVLSPQQDVSRTHVEVAARDGEVLVTDLGSTNGTTVSRPGETDLPERLPPGTPVAVPVGSVLDIGDNVHIRIEEG